MKCILGMVALLLLAASCSNKKENTETSEELLEIRIICNILLIGLTIINGKELPATTKLSGEALMENHRNMFFLVIGKFVSKLMPIYINLTLIQ